MSRSPAAVAAATVCVIGLLLAGYGPAAAEAATGSASLVNTIETWRWSPPSPDPSGLAYDSVANRLVVVDGEVEEMSSYSGANYYEAALTGGLLRTTNTLRFSPEPVGAAFAPGRVFVSDDDADRIHQVTLGSDGRFDALDPVASFSTTPYGSGDPEGLAYDATGGRLFIADGVGAEIYQVASVDGVFGNGNDQTQHFDTVAVGIRDPEAVEFVPERGTLYTIGHDGSKVVELTTSGGLVAEVDTSFLPLDRPAGLAWAPRSTDATRKSLYIADRKVDNDCCPSENDGAIYELAIEPDGGTAGVDVRVRTGSDDAEEATATGSVKLANGDLELVTDGPAHQVVGLRFGALAIPTGATITKAWIQFTADEAQSVTTDLTLSAQASDNAATFTTATRDVSSRPRTAAGTRWSPQAWTAGAAGVAQRTPDLSAVVQEVVSRPGWTSGNALAFIITGTGHRTAESYEGGSAKAPLLHVEYSTDDVNRAPTVSTGPDQSITLPASAALDGSVSDDGRPDPTPAVAWSKVSGPGTVAFSAPSSEDTSATFSAAGTYVLRLTADDGALTASDEVTVEVREAGAATLDRRLTAGSDDAEETGGGSVVLTSSDLELVTDGTVQQTVGVRFSALDLPAGATITGAWIEFTADEAQSVTTALSLRAQASDNAATFTTSSGNVSSRPRTTAAVSWSPPSWTVGAAQRTPDLSAVVQEVVSRSGWTSGNALAFIVTGTGHRTAEAFESGAATAPLLHVEYR